MAAGLLLGTVELEAADAPLRIPDRYLGAFADGVVLSAWLDGCLALWPRQTWSRLSDRVLDLPLSAAGARDFRRLLFASAVELPLDPDRPRVTIPPGHRRLAGIDGPAVLVGAGDHAELWSAERWVAVAARSVDDLELPVAV